MPTAVDRLIPGSGFSRCSRLTRQAKHQERTCLSAVNEFFMYATGSSDRRDSSSPSSSVNVVVRQCWN